MRKIFTTGLLVLGTTMLLSLTACAKINVTLDSKPLNFDVNPEIMHGRTMVPMRGIFEALGATISWDDETKTVTAVKDSDVIKATIGKKSVDKNGEIMEIDSAPVIKDGRTLVPVRFISESLGYNVRWDDKTSTVHITSGENLEVHFIDVGQADCSLIIQGDDALLVDGGNKADGPLVLDYIKSQGVEDLDYVICTHGHEDHVGGLPYIIDNIKTDVVITDNNNDSGIFNTFINTISENNIEMKEPEAGESFNIGESSVTIVAPVSDYYSDYNDNSVVFRLVFGNNSFLFTGDAGVSAESDILSSGAYLHSDVLKAGHHGSHTATSIPFISAVSPKYAVISCGSGNSYGHPHIETLQTFSKYGVAVFRTDEQGTIIANSDGTNLTFSKTPETVTVETAKPQPETSVKPGIQETVGSYIGNKNSKKLHKSSCGSLPAEKNRVVFNSIQEAINQGYTACKNCDPF